MAMDVEAARAAAEAAALAKLNAAMADLPAEGVTTAHVRGALAAAIAEATKVAIQHVLANAQITNTQGLVAGPNPVTGTTGPGALT